MSESALISEKTISPEEGRKASLHLGAAIYHLHRSMVEMRGILAKYHPREMLLAETGPTMRSLERSQQELANALGILVEDPEDGK